MYLLESSPFITGTVDDLYWTIGRHVIPLQNELAIKSTVGSCVPNSGNGYNVPMSIFSKNRSNLNFNSCFTDNTQYNCPSTKFGFLLGTEDYNIDDKYQNLYTSSVGNFQFAFTFS